MDEAEEIKRKKAEELQKKMAEKKDQEVQMRIQELQKQAVLRTLLTKEARERLVRIKVARPDFASQIENMIIQLAQQGRIKQKIDDQALVGLLRQVQSKKKDFKIYRR
ncbi:MAG: DNA-binding protein [Candidatus Methanofastidiosia archaeon]